MSFDPDRSTDGPTQLRLLNIVCRGSANEWRQLFADCKRSATIRAVLPMVEPELAGAARLWDLLLKKNRSARA
jgi:hypothetical protein